MPFFSPRFSSLLFSLSSFSSAPIFFLPSFLPFLLFYRARRFVNLCRYVYRADTRAFGVVLAMRFSIPRHTEAVLLLPTDIYIYIPLLANLTDNSSLLHSPSTRSARLTFFPRSSSPLRYLLPCTPFIFQRARAIGILTTEAALSSPRYPDPDGCEISRTRLARVQSIISSQNVFDVWEGKHITSTIFSPLSFIAILDVPRNPLSLVQFFRDSIVRIFDA